MKGRNKLKLSKIRTKDQAQEILNDERLYSKTIKENKNFFYKLVSKKNSWSDDNILSVDDLLQESYISFIKALREFNPSDSKHNASLSTFAYTVISNDLSRKYKNHLKKLKKEDSLQNSLFSIGQQEGGGTFTDDKDERKLMKYNHERYNMVDDEIISKMMIEEITKRLSPVDIKIVTMRADGIKASTIAKAVKMDRYTYKKYVYKYLPRIIHSLKAQVGES